MDIETENVINLIFPEGIPGKINFITLRLIVNALLLNNTPDICILCNFRMLERKS